MNLTYDIENPKPHSGTQFSPLKLQPMTFHNYLQGTQTKIDQGKRYHAGDYGTKFPDFPLLAS